MGQKVTAFNEHYIEAHSADVNRMDESREKALDAARLAYDLRSPEHAMVAQAYATIYRADVARASSVID